MKTLKTPETSEIIKQFGMWAITTYGIESLIPGFQYYIQRSDLQKHNKHGLGRGDDGVAYGWIDHLREKAPVWGLGKHDHLYIRDFTQAIDFYFEHMTKSK